MPDPKDIPEELGKPGEPELDLEEEDEEEVDEEDDEEEVDESNAE